MDEIIAAVKAASVPGRYGDGDGLFLLIGKRGGKSWMVRIQKDGRRRDIGLGSASKVPLKLAFFYDVKLMLGNVKLFH